ncbi:MAG: hypothetical protein H7250_06465 [Flavobacterium sp.]|nr:hypothetical protein [Flavobacterium sp.]
MIERIKEFLENRMIRSVLKKASADIFTLRIDFEYLETKYCKNKKNIDKLLIYTILEIASQRTPMSSEEKFNKVQNFYIEYLQLIIESKQSSSIIEIAGLRAKKQFLETKVERESAEELMEYDKYSFTSIQYRMEQASKGAITQETYNLIKKQSEELSNINNKIMKLNIEKNKN